MEKRTRTPRGSIAAQYGRNWGWGEDRIVGSREIAALFGVSRQRIGQLSATDPTFPHRLTVISGGPLWYRSMIELWASVHRPMTTRPDDPVAGIGPTFLGPAERESRRRRLGYIQEPHLWLGFFEPGAAPGVADVLATLGIGRPAIAASLRRLPPGRRPYDAAKLGNIVGERLERGVQRARAAGRVAVTEFDLAIVLVDAELHGIATAKPESESNWIGGRQGDAVLMHLERRGLDPALLRERLVAAEADPAAIVGFEPRQLRPFRRRKVKLEKPPWLGELARNPLGHDPWQRRGWGSVFFMTPDERQYKVDGYQWFFHVDADGYPVRTVDGRPVGYRWRVEPLPPATEMERSFEVLPMPPDPVANWPDRRYGDHD